jgi:predicted nucleic acid-binding protein
MASAFVDSTTLLYLLDRQEPMKRRIIAGWLRMLSRNDALVVNAQVLNEAYWVLRRKARFRVSRGRAQLFVNLFRPYVNAPAGLDLMDAGWALEARYGLAFYDALLLVSARLAGCGIFLSEDLNHLQDYGGVRAVNPFRHAPEDVLGPALP